MQNIELRHLFMLIGAAILVAALVSAFVGKNLIVFLPIAIVVFALLSLRRS